MFTYHTRYVQHHFTFLFMDNLPVVILEAAITLARWKVK